MGEQKDFKDNSERARERFSRGVDPLSEEASFEQLLGQLDIPSPRPATQGSVTQLFSVVKENAGLNSAATASQDAEKQGSQASIVPNGNSVESKHSDVPATAPKLQELRNEAPGDFTRIFTKLPTPRTVQPAILSELPAANRRAASSPSSDSFTQFFQTVEPVKASSAEQARASRLSPAAEPLAKEPPAPAALYQPPPPSNFSSPVNSQPSSGGFTELLNALGSDRPSNTGHTSADAVKSSFSSPARRSDESRTFADAQSSTSFASSSAPDTAPRPGEFTQLLQSLQRPSESRPSGNATPIPPPPAQAPPFERNVADSNPTPAAPSDFTRVMKSAAARANSAAEPAPAVPQQQDGAVAGMPQFPQAVVPQLPQAAMPQLAPPVVPVRTLLERLAPWLLVINGVLLVLLTVLISLFLLRQHH